MDLNEVIDAHAAYANLVKKHHRQFGKLIGAHLAKALPDGVAFEWRQGRNMDELFEADYAVVFPAKTQVTKSRWIATEDITKYGFYLDDGVGTYKNDVEGFTKSDLRLLIKAWNEIPPDVLDQAFGNAIVRVLANGKVATREN